MKVRKKKQTAISVLAVLSVLISHMPAAEAVGIVTATFTYNTIVEVVTNSPPVANDDSVVTTMNTPVVFNILDNDYDPDGDTLSLTNHVDPKYGTLVCNYEDGQCEYTPDNGFIGLDSFSYEITDGLSNVMASVIISVTISKVAVDVKPGSCPNPFNSKKKGVLPIAILGTNGFDVTQIDPASIELASVVAASTVRPVRWDYEDVATPFDGEQCDCHTLGPDGYIDLTLKFDSREVTETLGLAEKAGETIPLFLVGNLSEEFGSTLFYGVDCVWVLK